MYYYLCILILAAIWIVNGIPILKAARKNITSGMYIHLGFIIFFSLLTIEMTLGSLSIWTHLNISTLRVIGFLLYIPSIYLVGGALYELHRKGSPKSSDPTESTRLIESGVFAIIRQPMTLGMSIWSIALMMIFQSWLAIVLGTASIYYFTISARSESPYNISKFGGAYRKYMNRVPMWNVFRGLKKA
ncbi:MAG: isoprenylcysteine carboxylmethyltransferase family protein [Calditrichaeota bacterium]|nr:isoprenylcysteine carboxylmethyltransferase family protein [Calditrichota bacterium]